MTSRRTNHTDASRTTCGRLVYLDQWALSRPLSDKISTSDLSAGFLRTSRILCSELCSESGFRIWVFASACSCSSSRAQGLSRRYCLPSLSAYLVSAWRPVRASPLLGPPPSFNPSSPDCDEVHARRPARCRRTCARGCARGLVEYHLRAAG